MTDKEYEMCQKDPNLLWSFISESEKRNYNLTSQLGEMREYRDLYYRSLYLEHVSLFACGCIFGAFYCGSTAPLLSKCFLMLIFGILCTFIGFVVSSIFSGVVHKIEQPIFFQRSLWFSFLAVFAVVLLFSYFGIHPQ